MAGAGEARADRIAAFEWTLADILPDAAARMLESHDVPRITPDLNAITIPTLVIQGRRDVIRPPSVSSALRSDKDRH